MVEIYVTYTCFIYAAHMSTYMKCFNLIYIPHKCHIQHIYCHICNICTLTWLIYYTTYIWHICGCPHIFEIYVIFYMSHICFFSVWGELQTCTPHLHTVAALPWEVQKVIFQQDSTVISIKQLFFSKISKHLHKHAVIGFKQRQMSVTD